MAIVVKKTKGSIRVDSGEYSAKITKVELKQSDKFPQPFLSWHFAVNQPTFEGEELQQCTLFYITSASWTASDKNKLNKLLKAAGIEAEDGDEMDIEEALVGRTLRIVVDDKSNEKGETFSQIVTVMAPKAVKVAPKPAPVAAPKVAPKAAPVAPKAAAPKVAPKPAPKAAPVEEVVEEAAVVEEDVAPPAEEDAASDNLAALLDI
jgi:hypothetical protein